MSWNQVMRSGVTKQLAQEREAWGAANASQFLGGQLDGSGCWPEADTNLHRCSEGNDAIDIFMPVVASVQECEQACELLRDAKEIALACKESKGKLSLVQLASSDFVFLFDMMCQEADCFERLTVLLESDVNVLMYEPVVKANLLKNANIVPKNVINVGLLHQEVAGGQCSFDQLVALVSDKECAEKYGGFWATRPLSTEQRSLIHLEATSLFDATQKLREHKTNPSNFGDSLTEWDPIFNVLPLVMSTRLKECLRSRGISATAHSVVLDVGQPLTIVQLHQEPSIRLAPLVSERDLLAICDTMGGSALRALGSVSVGASLHRCHSMCDPFSGAVTSLTIRIGRAVVGASNLFRDIVASGKDILLLGFGKTTVLRDIATQYNGDVAVIDTRGEIGGYMRRFVPSEHGGQATVIQQASDCEMLIIDDLWAVLDFIAVRQWSQKCQVIAGCPARDMQELQTSRPGHNFDTVVELLSPKACCIVDVASQTTQLRMQSPEGNIVVQSM
jgi:hypothetical protein